MSSLLFMIVMLVCMKHCYHVSALLFLLSVCIRLLLFIIKFPTLIMSVNTFLYCLYCNLYSLLVGSQGVNVNGFCLFHYLMAHRTLSLSQAELISGTLTLKSLWQLITSWVCKNDETFNIYLVNNGSVKIPVGIC